MTIIGRNNPTAPPYARPETAQEAQQRFFARYGPRLLRAVIGQGMVEPTTVQDWIALARQLDANLARRERIDAALTALIAEIEHR